MSEEALYIIIFILFLLWISEFFRRRSANKMADSIRRLYLQERKAKQDALDRNVSYVKHFHVLKESVNDAYKKQGVPFPDSSPRDWTCDALHENGNYMNVCITCSKAFKGHKRRMTCRECALAYKLINAEEIIETEYAIPKPEKELDT